MLIRTAVSDRGYECGGRSLPAVAGLGCVRITCLPFVRTFDPVDVALDVERRTLDVGPFCVSKSLPAAAGLGCAGITYFAFGVAASAPGWRSL